MPPDSPAVGYDWLSQGGAYWLIGISWVLCALSFSVFGMRSANAAGKPNDGCLMIICCTLVSIAGGGVGLYLGLLFTRYPNFVLTSILGAVLFPAIATAFLVSRLKSSS